MTQKKVVTEVAVIKNDMHCMKEKLDEVHKLLVGNGKPGLVADMNQAKGAIKILRTVGGVIAAFMSGMIGMLAFFK